MERTNSINERSGEATVARDTQSGWFFGTIFVIWALIGVVLGFVADSIVGVFATVFWSGVLLAFGAWLLFRMWIRGG